MATVTGLTAARMLEIEANSIVDGTVNEIGSLILTKHDGTQIDAGGVMDPLLPGVAGQYYDGTKTWQNLTKSAVGLGNVDNTADVDKPMSKPQTSFVTKQTGKTWTTLGNKIGFIGDSYSTGLGLPTPATQRWTKVLATMADAAESNVAVSSSGYNNTGVGGASKFSQQAVQLDPDCTHVIVMGGINDAPLALSQAQVTADMNAMVTAIRNRIPNVPITIISPMWMASQPSAELLIVETRIRAAVPSDVRFIEGGPWMRIDRSEWQQGDGHPNTAGAAAIASWVRDQLGGTPNGAEYHEIIMSGTADKTINTTNFPGFVMGSSNVWGAKSGFWVIEAQMVIYTISNGFTWIKEQSRKVQLRNDIQSAAPMPYRQKIRFYHPGGDLAISYGYDPSTGTPVAITSGQTNLKAIYDGVK